MNQWQLAEESRKAIEEFHSLPPEVQWRQLIAWGLINEKGEVLWNKDIDENSPEQDKSAPANGTPAQPPTS